MTDKPSDLAAYSFSHFTEFFTGFSELSFTRPWAFIVLVIIPLVFLFFKNWHNTQLPEKKQRWPRRALLP